VIAVAGSMDVPARRDRHASAKRDGSFRVRTAGAATVDLPVASLHEVYFDGDTAAHGAHGGLSGAIPNGMGNGIDRAGSTQIAPVPVNVPDPDPLKG
jgi:hypothetical protein